MKRLIDWLIETALYTMDRLIESMDKIEVTWTTFITKVLPLVVPLVPAFATQRHVTRELGYGAWAGWTTAFIVEGFGYAAMYKAVQFYHHNLKYSTKENQAPFVPAILIYVSYLVIVIALNVTPELHNQTEGYKIGMNLALILLTVPAGILTAISALHYEIKAEIKNRRVSRTNAEQQPNEQGERTPRTNTPNERRLPNSERTPVPQPVNEHPFLVPNKKRARIEQAAGRLEAELGRRPSVREVQDRLRAEDGTNSGWSTSTISAALKGGEG